MSVTESCVRDNCHAALSNSSLRRMATGVSSIIARNTR